MAASERDGTLMCRTFNKPVLTVSCDNGCPNAIATGSVCDKQ